jgi:alpha-N-arabinofuranosidase
MDAISFHYYTHPKGDVMSDKGAASGFPESEWISTLKNALHLDGLIAKNVTVLDRNDPENNIAFYVDEWGAWYNPEPNTNPAFLQQKNTLRDAMVAALHFNTFHKYAKRVKMANIAQMVNILHSVIETREEAMLLTPTYHAFHLYRPFMGARVLPVRVNKTPVYSHAGVEMPALSISAAEKKGGGYVLALLNSDANKTQEIRIDIGNKKIGKASARQLSAPALDAHNSFERPQQVVPEAVAVAVNNGELKLTLPAASITVIELQ